MNPQKFIYTDLNGNESKVTILQFITIQNNIFGIMIDKSGNLIQVPINMLTYKRERKIITF